MRKKMAYQNINDCCQKLYFNVIQINKSRGTILETNKSQALCMKSQFQLKNQLGLVLLLHYLLQESQRPNYTHTHTPQRLLAADEARRLLLKNTRFICTTIFLLVSSGNSLNLFPPWFTKYAPGVMTFSTRNWLMAAGCVNAFKKSASIVFFHSCSPDKRYRVKQNMSKEGMNRTK